MSNPSYGNFQGHAAAPRPRRRWPWALAGAFGVVVLLLATFVGWVVLTNEPPAETGPQPAAVLLSKPDVERVTKVGFADETDDDPRQEPDEFRGADVCRTAWQPLRGVVVGTAVTADRTYDSGSSERPQVELGVARFSDETAAQSVVDRINNDVARCAQSFFVREDREANDWRVQQSAGGWYLRPVVPREGNWYCAAGVRSEGRFVVRALQCGTGSNYVSALLNALARRIASA
ncbi:sensor domain-containing protein [Tsukamurella tyrosinosolvens]|uniref:sensor domain-containing protein n=1 Tax=Tsukamurella tyrosinosolvens TaxID=57704 RepID=UPI0036973356